MGRLQVSENSRYLCREDGTPFFYLADTAWELFHRLTRDEASLYLEDRAAKGYTAIQAVVLAELDGLHSPNAEGHFPLDGDDPTRPNESYFDLVDHVVETCNELGMYCAMLPTWGDKWCDSWGKDRLIFNPENAKIYAEFLAHRYRDRGIIWVLGGDRPVATDEQREIIRAMAQGIRNVVGDTHLLTFHPKGGNSSAIDWPDEEWLDFHMLQSGHVGVEVPNYDQIARDYRTLPVKPCTDGEPRYEDHPIMTPEWKPTPHRFGDWDVRKAAYHALFSGAHGHTYGCHPIWQMYDKGREEINHPGRPWHEAIHLPGAAQMQHAKKLLLSRPFFSRIPDNGVILDSFAGGKLVATRDGNGTFLMVYLPEGGTVLVDQEQLTGNQVRCAWFDPRTGLPTREWVAIRRSQQTYDSPTAGVGNDWVLVVDDASTDLSLESWG